MPLFSNIPHGLAIAARHCLRRSGVTLTAAVSLFQQVGLTIVTTASDMISFSSPPVTYAQLEALRVHSSWQTP